MTAETAVVLPVLVAFTLALVCGLLVVAAQIQCVDAARTGARAAARHDAAGAVVGAARDAAPRGARVMVSREADRVRVVVVAEAPMLRGLPFEVREEAVATVEREAATTSGATVDRRVDRPPAGGAADREAAVVGQTDDRQVDGSRDGLMDPEAVSGLVDRPVGMPTVDGRAARRAGEAVRAG